MLYQLSYDNFVIKMEILFAHAITTSTARASSVSIELYKHDF